MNHGYAPQTINSMLAAINDLFRFVCWNIKVKFLKNSTSVISGHQPVTEPYQV